MTLIIGFTCKDGIALVSDTKITNLEDGEAKYDHKILTPLPGIPFIIGAAGYTNLFREFYRKVPIFVNQRFGEIAIKNIEALMNSGFSREEAFGYIRSLEKEVEKVQQPIDLNEKPKSIDKMNMPDAILPYVYSGEHFLDDCKTLIREISEQTKEETPFPLEVLIGLKKNLYQPSLHYVNWNGQEEQIDDFYSIGSGSPHVKQFFGRLWDANKDMNELISLAFFTIAFVQDVAKDNYVGFSNKFPPEAVVIYNDGVYGREKFKNENEILEDVRKRTRDFEKNVIEIKIKKLEST